MILARYINSYQDGMALSQAEVLYKDRETAIRSLSNDYEPCEIDINTENCDEYGWEFQSIAVNE